MKTTVAFAVGIICGTLLTLVLNMPAAVAQSFGAEPVFITNDGGNPIPVIAE